MRTAAAHTVQQMRTLYVGRLSASGLQSEGAPPVAMPRDNRVFTLFLAIAVCLHIVRLHICMLWLTEIMQGPTTARRALAVELLKGLDRMQTRRHRSRSLSARSRFAHKSQRQGQHSAVAHPSFHRPESLRLPPGLHLQQAWPSAEGTAMDGSGLGKLVQEDTLNASRLCDVPTASPELVQKQNSAPASSKGTLKTDDAPHSDSTCTPPPSDNGALGSDTTSTIADESASPKAVKPVADFDDDAVAGAGEDDMESPDRTLVDITDTTNGPITPQYYRHRRNFSVDSASNTTRRSAPRTLRAQRNNNGGLLEFRASAAKPVDTTPTRAHGRNTSMTLTIPKIVSQVGGSQQTQVQAATPDKPSIAAQAELELQYKYRHIFIGTASLHDLLDTLDLSTLTSTTKLAVMKAFVALASKEQRLYRRNSINPDDWDLVTRITSAVSDFDCITMARVRVGSITLQQFVDSIPFDSNDETSLLATVEGFKNASRMDAEQGRCGGSKTQVFRAWLLSQDRPEE